MYGVVWLEEDKGLNTCAFVTMACTLTLLFCWWQAAGQARPSWRRGLTWQRVSSFTRWAPSTRAGTARRPRAPCTAATATSCSSPSKHSTAQPTLGSSWDTEPGNSALHKGLTSGDLFLCMLGLVKDMKTGVVSHCASCLWLSLLWCRENGQRDLSWFKSWNGVARAVQRSVLQRRNINNCFGFCAGACSMWVGSLGDTPTGRSDCCVCVFGFSALLQQTAKILSQAIRLLLNLHLQHLCL